MSAEMESLSTKIVSNGVQSGPYARSANFSVKVQQGLPNILNFVNLKYVKIGYQYLTSYGVYVTAPMVAPIIGAQLEKLLWDDFSYNYAFVSVFLAFLVLLLYFYTDIGGRHTYLIDFACFRPPEELKVSKEEYIDLARKSGNFDETTLKFQETVLKSSGIGDQTYLPKTIFHPGFQPSLKESREEAGMLIFGAVDDLLAATKIKPKDIRILIVNSGTLNTTPSLSAMVINHYKLKHNVCNFNLGGMGCSAGIIAIDLANDLLKVYPGSYALVISTEPVSYSWYTGKDLDAMLPNCYFRMGAAAMLLSSRHVDRWKAKYELKQVVRTNKAMDSKSFNSIHLKEDAEGKLGISVSKEVIKIARNALMSNVTTLSPLEIPLVEQCRLFATLLFRNDNSMPYIPDYKRAFEHVCVLATSKRALSEIEKSLEFTKEDMEASWRTLERFGNTSSSSVWYELAYLEANSRIKRGDRVWQIATGSGIKCNSAVWKALRTIQMPNQSPWLESSI